LVVIFGADHIYRMNIASMIDFHLAKRAEVSVAAIPVPRVHAAEFGVIEAAEDGSIKAFHEKKAEAPTMPGDPRRVYASMGNYVFSTQILLDLLKGDAKDPASRHDFGMDILPRLAGKAPMYAYNFETNRIPGEPEDSVPYWRDVGTIDAYYEASMDLNHIKPELNLYNREWPVRSTSYPDPPAKFVFDEANRRGEALDSIVSGGCILSGGIVRKSVLGRGVRVHTGAVVEDCVIMDNCDIGRHAKVRRAILDKNVRLPEDALVGYDHDADRARGWHVTESGIVVIGREHSSVPLAAMFA
jgi:glucose-1-phosphate adenylyltransferase